MTDDERAALIEHAACRALEALRPIAEWATRLEPVHSFATVGTAHIDGAAIAYIDLRTALAVKTKDTP